MDRAVSVVVTCHNLEMYIGAAIESVLRQRYNGPVELLVVDDASSDSSAALIKGYDQVRYLPTLRNVGVLLATVLAIRESSCDLVFFLDGDDLWHPDKLRLSVERFASDASLGLLTHDLEYIDSNGGLIGMASRPEQVMRGQNGAEGQLIRDGILLHSDYVWLGSAYSIRKSVINADGFCKWVERLAHAADTYQDWPLAFWAASHSEAQMGYLPRKLFQYRVHGANHSGDARSVEKALRNFRRAYNTVHAMQEIAVSKSLHPKVMRATRRKLAYCGYLVDLYSGHRWAALGGFIAAVPYLIAGPVRPLKELARLLGVQLLGVRRFIAFTGKSRATTATDA